MVKGKESEITDPKTVSSDKKWRYWAHCGEISWEWSLFAFVIMILGSLYGCAHCCAHLIFTKFFKPCFTIAVWKCLTWAGQSLANNIHLNLLLLLPFAAHYKKNRKYSVGLFLLIARHHQWPVNWIAGGWRNILWKAADCLLCASVPLSSAVGPVERRVSWLGWSLITLLTAISTENPSSSAEAVGITLLCYRGLKVMLCAC